MRRTATQSRHVDAESGPSQPDEVVAAAVYLLEHELIPTANAYRRRLYQKAARVLSRLVRKKAARQASEPSADAPELAETRSWGLDRRAWGMQLRRRREELGLTREQLAELAGVAASTIRNVETGRHAPTRKIALSLQAVPALKLPVPRRGERPRSAEASDALSGHCWLTPDFNVIEQSRELARLLNGRGGRLDPMHLFLEPASAAAWCELNATGEALRVRAGLPLAAIASAVHACLDGGAVDIFGLGAGEAHAETALVQQLGETDLSALRLFLLDSSPALLTEGLRRARSAFAGKPRVRCYAVHGDMRQLQRYAALLEAPRRRLVCMFGDTFCTLENEATFVRHSLDALREGDLLLLEVPIALSSPEAERHLQPGSLARAKASPLVSFLTGPVRRHHPDAKAVELSAVLDLTGCVIEGSYAVEYQATVRMPSRAERRFSVRHAKRYDGERLGESLKQMGWELVERWGYGDGQQPRAVMLLRKCGRW